MSKPQKRGKLRNPPRGRQYATAGAAIAVLIAVASIAYLYTTHDYGIFPAPSTTSSSGSTSTSGTGSSTTSSGTGFNNTPCAPYATTTTVSGGGNYALICTNLGLIEVQLSPSTQSTQTVANFVSLAKSGFYNDLVWHRIVPGFVIQAGDPNTKNGGGDRATWGQGTSGTSIPFELDPNQHNVAGSIAMASTGAGVGGSSQFYINLVDNSQALDGKYAVFGQVINGMSVVQALAKVQVDSTTGQPVKASDAYIVSITMQNQP